MKFLQGVTYTFCVILIYIVIFALEFLLVSCFVPKGLLHYTDYLWTGLFLLLIFNPILTFFIGEKLPFTPDGLMQLEAKAVVEEEFKDE